MSEGGGLLVENGGPIAEIAGNAYLLRSRICQFVIGSSLALLYYLVRPEFLPLIVQPVDIETYAPEHNNLCIGR